MPSRPKSLSLAVLTSTATVALALATIGATALPASAASTHPSKAKATKATKGHKAKKAVAVCPTGTQDLFTNGDIDNDKLSDTVVGVPSATVNGQAGAGVIDVTLSSGTRQRIHSDDNPSAGDHFGAAVALGPFLDTGTCTDVAVGSPGTATSNGAVYIFAGTESGLSTTNSQVLTAHEPGDAFGTSIAVADDGVYVGAPDATVNGHAGAGAVYFFAYPFTGAAMAPTHTLTQRTTGAATPEAGDHFGASLAWTPEGLFIGSPDEADGSKTGAGNVIWVNGPVPTKSYDWTQNSPGVPGVTEAGDHFGASLAASGDSRNGGEDLIVGVPGEDIGKVKNAGSVQMFALENTGQAFVPTKAYDQDSKGVPGTVEAGDQFGASVTFGFQFTCTGATRFFPAVGAPGEDVGKVKDAGSVTVLATYYPNECKSHAFTEGSGGLGGTLQAGARVGATVSARSDSWLDDSDGEDTADVLIVGAPGQNVGSSAGAGSVIEVQPNVKEPKYLKRLTDSGGAVAGEGYGGAGLSHSTS